MRAFELPFRNKAAKGFVQLCAGVRTVATIAIEILATMTQYSMAVALE